MLSCRLMIPSSRSLVLVVLLGALLITGTVAAQSTASLATGKLLVAREGLQDPNFSRTVVLLVRYDESGAMGLVLNRQSHMRLDHLLPHLERSLDDHDPVFIGGPVAVRQATILSTTDEPQVGQVPVLGNLYATGDLRLLERMVTRPSPGERFRVYAGHAGWAPGQLEAEVLSLGWFVFPATTDDVFANDGEALWEMFIRRTRSRLAMR